MKLYLINLILFFMFTAFLGCQKEKESNQWKNAESFLIEIEQMPVNSPGYLQMVDSLYNVSKRIDFKKGIVKAISLQGNYLNSISKYDEALSKYYEAIGISKLTNDLYQLGDNFNNLGSTFYKLKRRDEAINAFKQAVEIRIRTKDSTGLGSSLNNIGFVFWQISDFDSAVFYFEKALSIRNKLPNKEFRATTYNNLGTVYFNWTLYDKALDYYLHSLELQREEGNSNGIALSLCNIGLVYKETAQNGKAIEYYRESLPYAFSSTQSQTVGYVYSCLGEAFRLINIDSSFFYFKKSLNAYRIVKNVDGEIFALQGIGNYYLDLKDLYTAKSNFILMLTLALKENIPMRAAQAYKYLGEIYLLENDLSTAKEYFEKSVAIGQKSKLNLILRDSYGNLSNIYERMGNKEKALADLKLHNNYTKQIENEGMQKRLVDLKNKTEYEEYQRQLQIQKYENEKQKIYLGGTFFAVAFLLLTALVLYRLNSKTKKINLLLQEKNILIEGQSMQINMKNIELLDLNESKEKLFSVIAHDLKSPFNVLINLGTLLKEDYHDLLDKERLKHIYLLEETAIKTYELLENLLNLSASHTGKISFTPGEVEVAQIADKVIDIFLPQANKKEISLLNKIEKDVVAFADIAMLEIVIRNLVSNAIKYCRQGGEVILSSYQEGYKLFVVIHDNGIGMDESTMTNIFNSNVIRSKNGTDGEKGTGLGLSLCKEFVEKHDGSIWVESELGKGSKFIFSISSDGKSGL